MNFTSSATSGLKSGLPVGINRIMVLLLMISLSLSGCFLVKVKKEVREYLASTVLVGTVATAFPGKGPIIVAAYTMGRGKRAVAHYTVLHEAGEFELMVAEGNYYIFAYWDKNSNLVYDAGEPAGQYGDPKLVVAPSGGVVGGHDIAIPEFAQEIDVPAGFEISSVKPQKLYSRLSGAIVDLDDELFSEENGRKGYWEAISFYKQFGGNIYFIEAYDPEKIPILFVHGANSTPRSWKYFVENIDRKRFQPWFFYYPSGARIRGMSYLLLWKLQNLKSRYGFEQLYITAHSMGGLVSRSFIMDHFASFPYVRLFVSLATPWGGAGMAEYGVSQSPVVVPCWMDMQPKSEFIKSLYREKMPEEISFYMFFGHQGSRNPFRSNNDSAIALASLLDRRAQSEAKMNYAFDEDHVSIIQSKAVVDQYNAIISAFTHPSGGYLKIEYAYQQAFGDERPDPTLILQPVGKKHAAMEIRLDADDSGRLLGPFPAGDYLAGLGALEAISKGNVPVTIGENETSALAYELVPDNVIYGTLVSTRQSKDWEAGMPYQENFTIQSITLVGGGIVRKPSLLGGEDNVTAYLTARRDCYYNGSFFFFGLPDGEFELIIRAQGYQPFVKHCFVQVGQKYDPRLVELTPE